jgi:hypothetical protein
VLKALRAHDEALGEELDELRRRLGARRLAPRRPGKIKLDVPAGRVGAPFVHAFNARLVEQTTASWEFWFGLLQAFVERAGHCRVPKDYRHDDGYALGIWVDNQRARQSKLSSERTGRLQALPGWVWEPYEADWEDAYARLRSFAEREGHSRVPTAYRDDDGYELGSWVHNQRRSRGAGKDERVRRLEALPGWTWDTRDASWEDGYARLLSFVQREGHSRVPDAYQADDGFGLGTWVGSQRTSRRNDELSEERARRLETLPGWVWEPYEAAWEDGYARLRSFAEREGHSRVPRSYRADDGFRLGSWVTIQRSYWRQGELPDERARRLQALPGWVWEPVKPSWDDGYARLLSFSEREGHSRVPRSYRADDGFRLGSWVNNQRSYWRQGELPDERARRLEALPGWVWEPVKRSWEDGYARLLSFVQREGHSRVPQSYLDEDGFGLGSWVMDRRQAKRRGRLREERARQLDALPGWTWDAREASWEDGYAQLRRFVKDEGHARVPVDYRADGQRLGRWVVKQRQAYRQEKLDPERRVKLEALPGWAWTVRGR